MSNVLKFASLFACTAALVTAQSQTAPNVSQVLSWSAVFNQNVYKNGPNGPQVYGVLQGAVPSVFAAGSTSNPIQVSVFGGAPGKNPVGFSISNFQSSSPINKINNAINSNIGTALSLIPLASPASGVIFKKDPATGVDLPANSTLGPVFTERGETIGKGKLYLGISHEDFHFTKLNGQSLNSLQVLQPGGLPSGIINGSTVLTSYPATFDIGMDVRLSQNIAFLTYGVTDRLDVSVGLPLVHAAVAARTFNGILYDGAGEGNDGAISPNNPNCWCAGTFNPGYLVNSAINFTLPNIGQSSLGKTGFGDLLARVKGTVLQKSWAAVAVGGDIRFATGDAKNYLGTGTTSVKPFLAVSLYGPAGHGIVFSPHMNLAWQFSGQSILGGQLQPNTQLTARMSDGTAFTYTGAPLTTSKDYLPDVLSWALGTEVAFGPRNTFVFDVLGNDVGIVHGVPGLLTGSASGFLPCATPGSCPAFAAQGLIPTDNRVSYTQFSGAFGYKARLIGNLIFTFNALTRFDSNGLTARFTPLYGLGYSF